MAKSVAGVAAGAYHRGVESPPEGWLPLLRRGDPAALAWLCEASARPIGGYLRRLVGDVADAEDLLQEFLLRVLRAGSRYDGTLPLRPWLYAIAHRLAIDQLRRRRLRRLDPLRLVSRRARQVPDPAEPPGAAQERSDLLATGMASLSPALREVLVLRYYQSLSFAEMEPVLGVPAATLRWRHAEALAALGRSIGAGGMDLQGG